MTVTIIGMGYVGLTLAAILANAGYKVYALEIDPERLRVIQSGKSFFHEDHLDSLVELAIESGQLIPTSSYEEAVANSEIIFSCVGTPDNPDGSSNLSFVLNVAEQVATYSGEGDKIFVQKSTVPVGTGKKIQQILSEKGSSVNYVSNPEFLREGTAIIDSLWFDRVVVGGDDLTSISKVQNIYKDVTAQRSNIAARAHMIVPSTRTVQADEYITTSTNSAELIKVTANAFLATKITFANSIAKLADAADADIVEVMNAVGADPRIGRSFLNAGRGFGGGCFPKDVSGLISSGIEYGVELDILHAVTQENDSMPGYIVEKVMNICEGTLVGKKVTVLGLTFKAGTSDVRKSPAIKIANLLVNEAGANVRVYDPVALQDIQTREDLDDEIIISEDFQSAITEADVVFVATDWSEFTAVPAEKYAELMTGKMFADCMNCFSPNAIRSAGLTYIGVGR
jgi:UDPglucose 6-dehydrogenase